MEKKIHSGVTKFRPLILFYLLLQSSIIVAQVGIQTATPHPSSALEISAENRNGGLLIPRIALQSTIDITTIPNPSKNLLVYNVTNNGVGDQMVHADYLYIYNGNQWKRLTNRTDLANSDDLPFVVAFGRKTTEEGCNGITSGIFNMNTLSNPAVISSSGELTAPKDGYYSFSVFFEFFMGANPSQNFDVSPFITAEGVTTYSTKFRGSGFTNQPRTITGTVYLLKDQKTKPFYWDFGTGNNCGTTGRIKGQQIVWDYIGNP